MTSNFCEKRQFDNLFKSKCVEDLLNCLEQFNEMKSWCDDLYKSDPKGRDLMITRIQTNLHLCLKEIKEFYDNV
ncbi:MAG: hypothetical protein E6R13_03895 [Spirochaetes bacterium]|nr:MAG: hypothetical protein E6R13_03895 [Spirochaetota bacterium]